MTHSRKHSFEIWEKVKLSLKKRHGEKYSDIELDDLIEGMTNLEIMDKYFDENNINSSEIYKFVNSIFGFNLDAAPVLSGEFDDSSSKKDTSHLSLSRVAIDSYLIQNKPETGADIRRMINHIFGINLDAISALEGARISLYSKDRWVIQNEKDLFVVLTGNGDIDVRIYPTNYFIEKTGLTMLPDDLQHSLTNLGYYYDEKIGAYYFTNSNGEAVSDAFKGQTMGTIMKVIKHSYSDL